MNLSQVQCRHIWCGKKQSNSTSLERIILSWCHQILKSIMFNFLVYQNLILLFNGKDRRLPHLVYTPLAANPPKTGTGVQFVQAWCPLSLQFFLWWRGNETPLVWAHRCGYAPASKTRFSHQKGVHLIAPFSQRCLQRLRNIGVFDSNKQDPAVSLFVSLWFVPSGGGEKVTFGAEVNPFAPVLEQNRYRIGQSGLAQWTSIDKC